jgi:hypothetical protein
MPAKKPPVFTSAVIVSHGPSNKAYVKARVDDGNEIYLYPDDSGTVDLRLIPIAEAVEIRNVSFVDTAGPTVYKANAQHIDLQNERVKAACSSRESKEHFVVRSKNTGRSRFSMPNQISVAHSGYRYEAIIALADKRYGSKTTSPSRMVGDMVDFYVRKNHDEVEMALKEKEEWEKNVNLNLDGC